MLISMLDMLTIVHSLADSITASRIRRTCKRLSRLEAVPTKHIYSNRVEYRVSDHLHRKGGAAIEYTDGYRIWCLYGKLHREDGPATEGSDGFRAWYLHGRRHREDGPAIEYTDGTGEWYLHGLRRK